VRDAAPQDVHHGVDGRGEQHGRRSAEVDPDPAQQNAPEERLLAHAHQERGPQPFRGLPERLLARVVAELEDHAAAEPGDQEHDGDAREPDRQALAQRPGPPRSAQADGGRTTQVEPSPSADQRDDEQDLEDAVVDPVELHVAADGLHRGRDRPTGRDQRAHHGRDGQQRADQTEQRERLQVVYSALNRT
jgi:hypothetical protein